MMDTEKQQLLLAYLGYYTLRRRDGTLAIDKVPAEWRDEILQRVEQRKQWDTEQQTADVSDSELADAVEAIL